MIRRPPRSTQGVSSAASDVYKRQLERVLEREGLRLEPAVFGEELRTAAEALRPLHDPALAPGAAGLGADRRLAGSKVLLVSEPDEPDVES